MNDWVYYMGFTFAVGSILFVFLGIPFIAWLGYTRKIKWLPSMEDLLKKFPNAMDDLDKRPPYNKLPYPTAMNVLYFELMLSNWLINLLRIFRRRK
jgi:hypothetical protein